jgi:hypothetical protein
MNRWAIVRIADGRVVTFVRADLPPGFTPPAGCRLVRESDLPAGWKTADSVVPSPDSITAYQARVWLIQHGYAIQDVDVAINTIQDPIDRELVRVWWEYEPELRRDASQIARWAAALSLTDKQVDDAFREAAAIQ